MPNEPTPIPLPVRGEMNEQDKVRGEMSRKLRTEAGIFISQKRTGIELSKDYERFASLQTIQTWLAQFAAAQTTVLTAELTAARQQLQAVREIAHKYSTSVFPCDYVAKELLEILDKHTAAGESE